MVVFQNAFSICLSYRHDYLVVNCIGTNKYLHDRCKSYLYTTQSFVS